MTTVNSFREIKPIKGSVKGKIILPGSKSMTHRALFMASLANNSSQITGALRAEDTFITSRALELLGVNIEWNGNSIRITPPIDRWKEVEEPILLGNSGTTLRLLLGVVAVGKGRFVLDGSERMRERPVGPVASALEMVGVRCFFPKREGYPPVEVITSGIKGGLVEVDARKSSQFLSSLLLSAPCAHKDVTVRWLNPVASFPYVKMTLRMMEERGIEFSFLDDNSVRVIAPQTYKPGEFSIEGDCSSASYFWAIAAISGGEVLTEPVFKKSYQGDVKLLDVLSAMGCRVEWVENGVIVSGTDTLMPVDVDMNAMPDMVPTLAVVAAFANGKSILRNIAHLRIKESDRLHAVATELNRMGAAVEIVGDDLIIRGGRKLRGETIRTYNDHRIAMAFAVAGLRVPGVKIENPEVVAKSYPEFWNTFEKLIYDQSIY